MKPIKGQKGSYGEDKSIFFSLFSEILVQVEWGYYDEQSFLLPKGLHWNEWTN